MLKVEKFSLRKKLNFFAILIVLISSIIFKLFNEDSKDIKDKLTRFYEAKMDSVVINSVFRVDSDQIRGGYTGFSIGSSLDHYPILVENTTQEGIDQFTSGSIITKNANSLTVFINNGTNQTEYKIWNPKSYDKNILDFLLSILFFGIPLIIIIFIPNSFWDKKNNK